MPVRQAVVGILALLTIVGLAALLLLVLAQGGWTPAKLIMMGCFIATAPWTGLCVANGALGFLLHRPCPWPAAGRRATQSDHVAVAMTVRNEDMRLVLPPLRALLDELGKAGVDAAFTLFVLSDTQDPAAVLAEEAAMASLRATARDPARIRYRRRMHNTGFKAGNIMDFLDHHADGFELMVVLDADSRMSAAAVLRLLQAMRDDPSLGIVQHLTVGLPTANAFPRLFQFGMRAGMRTWAAGQDWWQGNEGPYWGHNAILRIAPFRAHCRLPLLPDGRPILSHDQVEAALLRGAGWGVRVLVEEDGSAEANPPALPEFLRRELRWLSGNLQYRHLLRLPGLRPMGRWQLIQAILLFASTPFYLLFLCAASWAAATDRVSSFPAMPALLLTLAWPAALYAPKFLGYLQVLATPQLRIRYGGARRFAVGILAETSFTLLLDGISAVAKTAAMLRVACRTQPNWAPQNRSAREVTWGEATRLCWPQTLIGVAVFAGFAAAGWHAVLWAAPFALGLPLAIPFCVLTADARFGQWLQRQRVAAIPEELPSVDLSAREQPLGVLVEAVGHSAATTHRRSGARPPVARGRRGSYPRPLCSSRGE